LPKDTEDRNTWYFRVKIGNNTTSKFLFYNIAKIDFPYTVYEEWASPVDSVKYEKEGWAFQFFKSGEYNTIEEAFNNMCYRSHMLKMNPFEQTEIVCPFDDIIDFFDFSDREYPLVRKCNFWDNVKKFSMNIDRMFPGSYEIVHSHGTGKKESLYKAVSYRDFPPMTEKTRIENIEVINRLLKEGEIIIQHKSQLFLDFLEHLRKNKDLKSSYFISKYL